MLERLLNRLPWVYGAFVLVWMILPLFYIARYNHAGADDFEVSGLLVRTQSIWQTAMALMERSAAYTGVFAQAIFQPADVQGIGFRVVPVAIILTYLATFFVGIRSLLSRNSLQTYGLLALGFFAVFFRLMESPAQTFFWSMSAIAYASSYTLAIVFLVLLGRYLSSEQARITQFGLLFLAMVAALGTHPVVSLLIVGLCVGALCYAGWQGQRQLYLPLGLLLVVAVVLLGLILAAPGSLRRISESGHQGWLDRPVLSPLYFAFNMYRDYVAKWLSDSLFMLSSLALVAWLIEKRITPRLPMPLWLPFVLTFGFGYMWFAVPKLLVNYIALRQIDTGIAFFLTGWLVSLVYVAAFIRRQWVVGETGTWLRPVVFAAMIATLLLPQYVSNMRFLWVDIRSGTAARYDAEVKSRYHVIGLSRAEKKVLVLDSLQAMPTMIYKGDLEVNSNYWLNRSFASYFGIAAVTVNRAPDKSDP
ncbi:hypothetical protein [Rhodoflexus sp.]